MSRHNTHQLQFKAEKHLRNTPNHLSYSFLFIDHTVTSPETLPIATNTYSSFITFDHPPTSRYNLFPNTFPTCCRYQFCSSCKLFCTNCFIHIHLFPSKKNTFNPLFFYLFIRVKTIVQVIIIDIFRDIIHLVFYYFILLWFLEPVSRNCYSMHIELRGDRR